MLEGTVDEVVRVAYPEVFYGGETAGNDSALVSETELEEIS